MTADWTPYGGTEFLRWEYYMDYALNLATYVTGGRIPEDLASVYRVRHMMNYYRLQEQMLNSALEFVDKLGARTAPAVMKMVQAQGIRSEANRAYTQADMAYSYQLLEEAVSVLDLAFDRAFEARDQALLWVQLTEWLVLTSTLMMSGAILWWVMVRREVYRDVKETRLRSTWR